jgi:hypothetical protein
MPVIKPPKLTELYGVIFNPTPSNINYNTPVPQGYILASDGKGSSMFQSFDSIFYDGFHISSLRINTNDTAIALGRNAGYLPTYGYSLQGLSTIAIGVESAQYNQGDRSVAIGSLAGQNNQERDAISIGTSSGYQEQRVNAIAIGSFAGGQAGQGSNSIAIGAYSGGERLQASNTIILNASGQNIYAELPGRTYINPINKTSSLPLPSSNVSLLWNTITSEVTQSPYRVPILNFGVSSTGIAGNNTVSFSNTYESIPVISVTQNSGVPRIFSVDSVTKSNAQIFSYNLSGALVQTSYSWTAIGY